MQASQLILSSAVEAGWVSKASWKNMNMAVDLSQCTNRNLAKAFADM